MLYVMSAFVDETGEVHDPDLGVDTVVVAGFQESRGLSRS